MLQISEMAGDIIMLKKLAAAVMAASTTIFPVSLNGMTFF